MNANDLAEFTSLFLTVPTVLLAALVVYNYWARAQVAIRHLRRGEHFEDVDWLVVGIVVSFCGAIVDNLYWGIAWTSEFLDHPSRDFWFEHGMLSNIPFRQMTGIVAAGFHLWPVIQGRKKGNVYINIIAGLTLLVSAVLLIAKVYSD